LTTPFSNRVTGGPKGVFLLTGPSAAGKSTVGRLLAEHFERSVYLEGDLFRRAITSGREEMTPTASQEAIAQLRLRYEVAAKAADAYAREGFLVVLEDVVAGDMLKEVVTSVAARPLRVVVLMPSLNTVVEREAARAERGYDLWTAEGLYDLFLHGTERIGLWLDTSDHTPGDTVAAILAAAPEELAPAVKA
jgi:chloramphenicol 3-O-phosphotransferase